MLIGVSGPSLDYRLLELEFGQQVRFSLNRGSEANAWPPPRCWTTRLTISTFILPTRS